MLNSIEARTLTAALDTIDEAIGIYDADDRLIAFNAHYAAWRAAIGGAVAPGVCWDELVRASVAAGAIPEAIGREEAWLEHRRRSRGAYSVIRTLADGRSFKVNERRMPNGGVAVVWTEISDLMRVQEELQPQPSRDESHLQSLGQLAANVTHDFNNLLTAVMGNLTLLRDRLTPGDVRAERLLDNAMRGAERGAALVQRLLAFTRRRPAPMARAVDLAGLLEGMADLLRSALGGGVPFTLLLPPGLPPVLVDPAQLELAVLNVAVNARDAMNGAGLLAIEAETAQVDAAAFVVLRMVDTGVGMDEATLARATETLFTTKKEGQGTGLGLAMVQAMLSKAGGRLLLRSSPGVGTTVELWLPLARATG